MTPFEAYRLFHSLKLHFTSESYSYLKYNGRSKASSNIKLFERRNDKLFYARLAKHTSPKDLVVSNFLSPTFSGWVGDVLTPQAEQLYAEWVKRNQSLTYTFKSEIASFADDFVDNITPKHGQYPKLLVLYNQGVISPETLVIVDKFIGLFDDRWTLIADTIIWPKTSLRLRKYRDLCNFDLFKTKKILAEVLRQQREAI
jgi:hypothetical protein